MRVLLALLSLVPALLPALAHAGALDDPLDLLWGNRMRFAQDGSPLVTVRIDEGKDELSVLAQGAIRISSVGPEAKVLLGDAGERWRFRIRGGVAAELGYAVQVADLSFGHEEAVRAVVERWEGRGFDPRLVTVGGVFGIAGRVIDNRRYAVLLGAPGGRASAEKLLEEVRSSFGEASVLYTELVRRPRGEVEIYDPAGRLVGVSAGAAVIEAEGKRGITVLQVEHDQGYASHGRSDRSYRGQVVITVDAGGKAAAVSVLPMEELLRGIVPSEIFASAPSEALQAQAVAARGEVLAKIGVRHRADPYLLCPEQHCQVYKGLSGEHRRTDEAIALSRGEVLFGHSGRLVDSVYSSTCGGHTENNEIVWGTPPDPNLRGVPDWIGHPELQRFEEKVSRQDVAAFIDARIPGMCAQASFSRADKFRWERRFSAAELNGLVAGLGVGKVISLVPGGVGVSGRASTLSITGTAGAATVEGELVIRRLLKNLNSSLFVIEREGPEDGPATAWVFRGGGWGHGVGMCQMGAIGRAEAGHDHAAILRHYYNGAELFRIY